MRKLVPAIAAAALLAAGAATLPLTAGAQPAPAQVLPVQTPPNVPPPGPHGPMMGGGWVHGPWAHGPMMRRPEAGGPWAGAWMANRARHAFFARRKTWGLFHRPADLALSPADVQTIAEAILLRNGQHDWKVGDVTANADHTVSFAFVTAHGDVIARFTMNTENGRITRTD